VIVRADDRSGDAHLVSSRIHGQSTNENIRSVRVGSHPPARGRRGSEREHQLPPHATGLQVYARLDAIVNGNGGGAPNNGIFIDEGSKGYLFEDTVIYNTSGDPIRFNRGKREDHTWGRNFFGMRPDAADFPKDIATQAGLQPAYARLLSEAR